jgi:hypothetical protein
MKKSGYGKLILIACFITLFFLTFLFSSCDLFSPDGIDSRIDGIDRDNVLDVDRWAKLSSTFPEGDRYGPVSFTVGNYAYVGLGDNNDGVLTDFWQYNSLEDSWSSTRKFPGEGRTEAISFSLGGMGYVGMGGIWIQDGTTTYTDFWQYDQEDDIWTQKADVPVADGVALWGHSKTFTVNGKGYLIIDGSGEFLEYTPETDSWLEITLPAEIDGYSIIDGFCLSGTMSGYICMTKSDHTLLFYEYTPTTNTWVTKSAPIFNISESERFGRNYSWIVSGKGYLYALKEDESGENTYTLGFWVYDTTTDIWTRKSDFFNVDYLDRLSISFSVNDTGYIIWDTDAVYKYIAE